MLPHYDTTSFYNQMINSLQSQNQGGLPKYEVVRVSGRPGAESFQMAPNSEVLLLDATQPIIWLVQADGAGYKTLTPYDVSPHVEVKPEDKFKSLEDRITRLEEKIDAKSYTGATNRQQRNDTGVYGNDARRVSTAVHAESGKGKS